VKLFRFLEVLFFQRFCLVDRRESVAKGGDHCRAPHSLGHDPVGRAWPSPLAVLIDSPLAAGRRFLHARRRSKISAPAP